MHTLWAIDLGNSRLKLGRFRAGNLVEVHTYARARKSEALAWLRLQEAHDYALLATGNGEARWRSKLAKVAPVWSYEWPAACPLQVAYDTPATLGVDRLAAAVAAQAIYPKSELLIVDVGTCITYERVGEDATYLGGNISPGLQLRRRAMHDFTGKLPLVPLVWPETLEWGTSTLSALQLGVLQGAVREVAAYVASFRQNHPSGQVLLCGGDVPFLRPHLPSGLNYRPHLVLEGLAKLHSYANNS